MVLGVDPGGHMTGLCLVDGADVVEHMVITRDSDFDAYLAEVVRWIDIVLPFPTGQLALEDVIPPNPHMGLSNVQGILDTAQIVGAIRSHYDVTMIRPNRHGKRPLSEYPSELVGPNETAGTGKLRHVRSAYDIAQTYIATHATT